MPNKQDNCPACWGYAQHYPPKGVAIYPGMTCPGDPGCPLFARYVAKPTVTPSEHAKRDHVLPVMHLELEEPADGPEAEPLP